MFVCLTVCVFVCVLLMCVVCYCCLFDADVCCCCCVHIQQHMHVQGHALFVWCLALPLLLRVLNGEGAGKEGLACTLLSFLHRLHLLLFVF